MNDLDLMKKLTLKIEDSFDNCVWMIRFNVKVIHFMIKYLKNRSLNTSKIAAKVQASERFCYKDRKMNWSDCV